MNKIWIPDLAQSMTTFLCLPTRWWWLILVRSPLTCWLGRPQHSSDTSCLVLMMIDSPYLCGTWFCSSLGVPIPDLLANPRQCHLVVNLVLTLMVITFRRVSVNLQHYQCTNGSCISSVCCHKLVRLDTVGHPIDSGIGLSITIDKIRVFTIKTLSTESLINQLLIRGLSYQFLLIVGKFGQGMRSCKCMGVSDNDKCVSVTQW